MFVSFNPPPVRPQAICRCGSSDSWSCFVVTSNLSVAPVICGQALMTDCFWVKIGSDSDGLWEMDSLGTWIGTHFQHSIDNLSLGLLSFFCLTKSDEHCSTSRGGGRRGEGLARTGNRREVLYVHGYTHDERRNGCGQPE